MGGFAKVLANSIRARIQSGQNICDQAAAPLKPGQPRRRGYPDYKAVRGLNAIRDLDLDRPHFAVPEGANGQRERAVIDFLDEALPGRQTASQIA
jgi:hypothetical protein